MRKGFHANLVLLICSAILFFGGAFSGANETVEKVEVISGYISVENLTQNAPADELMNNGNADIADVMHNSRSMNSCSKILAVIKSSSSKILSANEIRDLRVIRELIKKVSNGSGSKSISYSLFMAVLYNILLMGFLLISLFPQLLPWCDIAGSRRRIISYIHHQDGQKRS